MDDRISVFADRRSHFGYRVKEARFGSPCRLLSISSNTRAEQTCLTFTSAASQHNHLQYPGNFSQQPIVFTLLAPITGREAHRNGSLEVNLDRAAKSQYAAYIEMRLPQLGIRPETSGSAAERRAVPSVGLRRSVCAIG